MRVGRLLAERADAALPPSVQHLLSRSVWLLFPLLAWPFAIWAFKLPGQPFLFPFVLAAMAVAYFADWVQVLIALAVSTLIATTLLDPIGVVWVEQDEDVVRLVMLNIYGGITGYSIYVTRRQRQALQVQARDMLAGEERYRRIVETANEGIWFQDADGNSRYVNQKMAELLRLTQEELMQANFAQFVHPQDLEQIKERRAKVLSGENTQGDARFIRADQTTAWFLTCCSPMRNLEQEVIGLVAMVTDITGRHEAEVRIRESEERFRTLTRHAPAGIFLTDPEGDCVFVNERWCQFAGLSPEEAAGKGWIQALHPLDHERVFAEWYEATQSRREFVCEYRFITPAGRETWLIGSAVSLRNPEGEVTGYLGTLTDITERKKVEDRCRETEERLRLALDVANLIYWDWDVANDRVVWSNLGPKFYGESPQTLEDLLASVRESDRERVRRELEASLHTGAPFKTELVFLAPDGSEVYIQSQAEVYRDESRRPIRMLGVARDITKMERTLDDLRLLCRKGHCMISYSEVEIVGDEVRWQNELFDEEGAQEWLPLEIPPGRDYIEASFIHRPLHDREQTASAATRAVREGQSWSQTYSIQDRNGKVHRLKEDMVVKVLSETRRHVVGVISELPGTLEGIEPDSSRGSPSPASPDQTPSSRQSE